MVGKVMKGIAGFYYVHGGRGKLYECRAKGIFRNRKVTPLVGDDVEFTILDEAAGVGNLDRILPRRSELIRPAVANVDQVVALFSVTHPEPNLNLLDRLLVTVAIQGVPARLVFNKQDLGEAEMMGRYRRIYEGAGYPVHFISALEQSGVAALRQLLRGKTSVLAGPSGVGKSTLTNCIQPNAAMETGTLSEKIQRGKHTTRHSELFYVEEGTFVMDTPGFSSIFVERDRAQSGKGPEQLETGSLKMYFPEFSKYEEGCRFQGCAHIGETVCGVKDAVAAGAIGASRYENYCLMYQELKLKRRY